MKTKMFAIYDTKALSYSTPHLFDTIGLAIRAVQEVVQEKKSAMGKYPADFILYEIGEYDQTKGEVKSLTHISYGPLSNYTTEKPKIEPEVVK